LARAQRRITGYWLREKRPWFIAALVAVSAHWAAGSIQDSVSLLLGPAPTELSLSRVAYVVIFALMVVLLYRERTAFVRPRTRYLTKETPEKREHLILFLSQLADRDGCTAEGTPSGVMLTGSFEEDLKHLVDYKTTHPYWRWEMPLRSVHHHIGKLKTITMICSPESLRQVAQFQIILKKYSPLGSVEIQVLVKQGTGTALKGPHDSTIDEADKGWDFDAFDDLSDALMDLLKKFRHRGIPENEIMIDFTGGTKVTSVVAAAITFNRRIKAQYVQTNSPWDVLSYDFFLGSADAGDIGF